MSITEDQLRELERLEGESRLRSDGPWLKPGTPVCPDSIAEFRCMNCSSDCGRAERARRDLARQNPIPSLLSEVRRLREVEAESRRLRAELDEARRCLRAVKGHVENLWADWVYCDDECEYTRCSDNECTCGRVALLDEWCKDASWARAFLSKGAP